MYKKILVPFDNSEPAQHALKNAVEMVEGIDDATIVALKVVEWHDYNSETFKIASRMSGVLGDSLDMNAISEIGNEAENKEAQEVKTQIAAALGQEVDIDIVIANGSPHDTIVAFASDQNFDCIVMGHRGMGVFRGMLGSVAYSVLQKANKPVLVVK